MKGKEGKERGKEGGDVQASYNCWIQINISAKPLHKEGGRREVG